MTPNDQAGAHLKEVLYVARVTPAELDRLLDKPTGWTSRRTRDHATAPLTAGDLYEIAQVLGSDPADLLPALWRPPISPRQLSA